MHKAVMNTKEEGVHTLASLNLLVVSSEFVLQHQTPTPKPEIIKGAKIELSSAKISQKLGR